MMPLLLSSLGLTLVFFLSVVGVGGQGVLRDQSYAPPKAVGSDAFQALYANAQLLTRSDYANTLATNLVPIVYATRFHNNSGSSLSSVINGELQLVYEPDATNNIIPDYSYAGYGGGGVPLPVGIAGPIFNFSLGSTYSDLQTLFDNVASQPIDPNTGFRGVIQFEAGTYTIGGVVTVHAPGVLFRGAGSDQDGTILIVGDSTFFVNNGAPSRTTSQVNITRFVPTGSRRIYLESTSLFSVGDSVEILLNIDDAWKAAAESIPSDTLPASYSVTRYVTSVAVDYIEVEAPVYYNIFTGLVAKLSSYYMHNIGWANFRVIRPSGNPNVGVFIDAHGGMIDVFVKNVVTEYVGTLFQGSGSLSRRFTFEDCVALFNPIVTGFDPDIRQMFRTYELSQMFIHRCHAVYGRAFLGIQATFKGSCIVVSHCSDLRTWRGYYIFGAWFPGQLIDHVYTEYGVDFGSTAYGSRTGVASIIWNTFAEFEAGNLARLQCTTPTGAMQNLCIGTTTSISDSWNYVQSKKVVLPSSLYIQQLKERVGCDVLRQIFYPSQLTGEYRHPTALSDTQWILSNMNTFETSRTDWNTSVAAEIYYGDPWSGSSQCLQTDYVAPVSSTDSTPSPIVQISPSVSSPSSSSSGSSSSSQSPSSSSKGGKKLHKKSSRSISRPVSPTKPSSSAFSLNSESGGAKLVLAATLCTMALLAIL